MMYKQSTLGKAIVVNPAGYDMFIAFENAIMDKYLHLDCDVLVKLIRDERERAEELCVDMQDTNAIKLACNTILKEHELEIVE